MLSPTITHEYEDKILELIENKDEYTYSDLQGIITVLVNKIMTAGQQLSIEQ